MALPEKKRKPSSYSKDELIKLFQSGEIAPGLTPQNIAKFARGEMTWAEVSGLTREEAYGFAQAALRLLKVGKEAHAKKILDGLVAANPKDGYFQALVAALYGRMGKEDEACRRYGLAIELDPDNLEARVAHAELLLKRGDFEPALKDLAHVSKLDPQAATPLGKRAIALARGTTQALHAALKNRPRSSGPPARPPVVAPTRPTSSTPSSTQASRSSPSAPAPAPASSSSSSSSSSSPARPAAPAQPARPSSPATPAQPARPASSTIRQAPPTQPARPASSTIRQAPTTQPARPTSSIRSPGKPPTR